MEVAERRLLRALSGLLAAHAGAPLLLALALHLALPRPVPIALPLPLPLAPPLALALARTCRRAALLGRGRGGARQFRGKGK